MYQQATGTLVLELEVKYGEQQLTARKPLWLKTKLPRGQAYESVRSLMKKGGLHTVCMEAHCPNMWECFSQKTATFLIMGSRCTRRCRFCAIKHGPTSIPDPLEPVKVAQAVQIMELDYVVITSVTRDDLPDGGAELFASTIEEIRKRTSNVRVEVLIPDFQGNAASLHSLLASHPDVLGHNLETVPRLYPRVRPEASYERSLEVLWRAKGFDSAIPTKTSLMLGLGEKPEEVYQTMKDLRDVNCSLLTFGQYLQPTRNHVPIERFVQPTEFDHWHKIARGMGFTNVASAPLVRSSYHAKDLCGVAKPLAASL